ncbi:MAG: hypothetical protein ACK4PR_04790 [Gammaproteobacteria bacterium]
MLPFLKFLNSKRKKASHDEISAEEITVWLPDWLIEIENGIQKLKEKSILPTGTATICINLFRQWQNNPTQQIADPNTIKKIDFLYQRLIAHMAIKIELNPKRLKIPNGYPFGNRVSGVEILVRVLVEENQYNKMTVTQSQERSIIGRDPAHIKNVLKEVNTNLGKIDWLVEKLTQLGKSINGILPKPLHAETIWFAKHAQQFVDFLKNHPEYSTLPLLNDDFPQIQLVQTSRIEIITSSSCCSDQCRFLFSALRLHLNDLGINLPIILYADTAYNYSVKYPELNGSVYVIKSSGEFFDTKMQCEVPSNQYQVALPRFFRPEVTSKERVDYACLALMGGIAIIDILKVGITRETYGDINPFTYIPPDSLIIYAADTLLDNPDTPAKTKDRVRYLIETLDNMSLRMLTYWRMGFIEYIHYLLISYLDPKFRQAALANAYAINLSLATPDTLTDESKLKKFYMNFLALWQTQSADELTSLYQKMLKHFEEYGCARMPLGSVLGPLSVGMIERNFSEPDRSYLLEDRQRPRVEEIVDESDEEEIQDAPRSTLAAGS